MKVTRHTFLVLALGVLFSGHAFAQSGPTERARTNARTVAQILQKCRRATDTWLAVRDPQTNLLPVHLTGTPWVSNPKVNLYRVRDSAADLYPFLLLSDWFTQRDRFRSLMFDILQSDVLLTTDSLGFPHDADLRPFCVRPMDLASRIFGASEYAKDGLTPVVELLGRTPWFDRMVQLVDAILEHAPVQSRFGTLPSGLAEVNGEMLQTLVRLYTMTGKSRYLKAAERIGDAYVFEVMPLNNGLPSHRWDFQAHTGVNYLNLRDHGCEIIGGLGLLFALENDLGRERARSYYAPLKGMLDKIASTANEDGLFFNRIRCSDLTPLDEELNDNWGYVYTAWLDFSMATGEAEYRDLVRRALRNLPKYRDAEWQHAPADGYADSIEGALWLLNRLPVPEGFDWVETESQRMLGFQTDKGWIEGWYGDGNWIRTALMVALYKTQGCWLEPWDPKVVSVGASRRGDTLTVAVVARRSWRGVLRFDRPRHRDILGLPRNYARINEFPEWYPVDGMKGYVVERDGKQSLFLGSKLHRGLPVSLKGGETRVFRVFPEAR